MYKLHFTDTTLFTDPDMKLSVSKQKNDIYVCVMWSWYRLRIKRAFLTHNDTAFI